MSWERADPWICHALCICGILMTKGGCQDLPWLCSGLRSITSLSLIKLCLTVLDPTWQSSWCNSCWNLIAPLITQSCSEPARAEEGTDLELAFPSPSQSQAAGAGIVHPMLKSLQSLGTAELCLSHKAQVLPCS